MSNRMQKIQEERGKPLKQIIVELFEQHGSQVSIAEELGVSQGTVSLWMMRLGLEFRTIIVEKESA